MVVAINNVNGILIEIENALNDLKAKCDSKQSERFLTSYVWMVDNLDRTIVKKLLEIRKDLIYLKEQYVNNPDNYTQFDTLIRHCDDIGNTLMGIIKFYESKPSYYDINLRFSQTLPEMLSKVKSMRNRFSIVRNQIRKLSVAWG